MAVSGGVQRLIRGSSARYGIPASTLAGLIEVESGGNIHAVSPVGAFGLTQFMPGTAKGYGVKRGDARSQVYGAAKYLNDLGYHKDPRRALKSYNAGPGNPGAAGNYDSKVLNAGRKYKGLNRGVVSGGGSSGGGSPGSVVQLPGSQPQTIPGPADTALADLLSERLQQPPPASSMGLQDPSFSAKYNVHMASGAPPVSSGPPAPKVSLTDQLAEVRKLQGDPVAQPEVQGQTVVVPGIDGPTNGGSGNPKKLPGVTHFDGKPVARWVAAELRWARKHGRKGTVNSGYRSKAEQTRIYNSGVRPAARPGTSNHEGDRYPRGAVDVSQAAQLARILARKPGGSPLRWAGSKDPVHFSHPHGGSY